MEVPMATMQAEIERICTKGGLYKYSNYFLHVLTADGQKHVVAHIVGTRHEIVHESNGSRLYIYGTRLGQYLGAFIVQEIEDKEKRVLPDDDIIADNKGSSGAPAAECGSGAAEAAAG